MGLEEQLSAIGEALESPALDPDRARDDWAMQRTEVNALKERADRLLALGVTPGATVTLLQRFPGIVFLCDQTELAVERDVAEAVLVRPLEART